MSVELGKGKDPRNLSTQKVIWHRADWAEGKKKKSKVRKGQPTGTMWKDLGSALGNSPMFSSKKSLIWLANSYRPSMALGGSHWFQLCGVCTCHSQQLAYP